MPTFFQSGTNDENIIAKAVSKFQYADEGKSEAKRFLEILLLIIKK